MAIHHKAPEQHYTTLMAHSGLPYDINPPPHSTDFIYKVVGGDKLFIFSSFFIQRVLTDLFACVDHVADTSAQKQQPASSHMVHMCPPAHLGHTHKHTHTRAHTHSQRHKK